MSPPREVFEDSLADLVSKVHMSPQVGSCVAMHHAMVLFYFHIRYNFIFHGGLATAQQMFTFAADLSRGLVRVRCPVDDNAGVLHDAMTFNDVVAPLVKI